MQRYKITLSYKGARYAGWQTQKNALTVQEVLEGALQEALNQDVKAVSSGRTDSGVHALGQVAHFDADTTIPPDRIPYILNTLLPEDISVLNCEAVTSSFHARFSAKRKTYRYSMYYSPHHLPLMEDTSLWLPQRPNVEIMAEASKVFVGEHDFKFFMATGSKVKDTIRTLYSVDVIEKGNEITLTVTGNGFLYNMVRILSGTLLYVGQGKLTVDSLYDIINSGKRKLAGKTLPAKALCLIEVIYE